MTMSTLFSRPDVDLGTIPDSITLSEAFTGFDMLIFICADSTDTSARYTVPVSVAALNDILGTTNPYYMRPGQAYTYGWNFTVPTTTQLVKSNAAFSCYTVSPKAIYGIKV